MGRFNWDKFQGSRMSALSNFRVLQICSKSSWIKSGSNHNFSKEVLEKNGKLAQNLANIRLLYRAKKNIWILFQFMFAISNQNKWIFSQHVSMNSERFLNEAREKYLNSYRKLNYFKFDFFCRHFKHKCHLHELKKKTGTGNLHYHIFSSGTFHNEQKYRIVQIRIACAWYSQFDWNFSCAHSWRLNKSVARIK